MCVGVQIKSGNSNQNKSKELAVLKSDKNHFTYWSNHQLPIVGIVYIPEDDKAYWIDITDYIKLNKNKLDGGPYTINISKQNVFDLTTYNNFYTKFKNYKDTFNQEWNFGRALKGLAGFNSTNERISSLKSLFHYHRNQKEAWYYIITQFQLEKDPVVQKNFIYAMRHLISHGDILWHENNIVSEGIRSFGRSLIKKTYALAEARILVNHIDEMGVSRGSFGQNIYPLLDLIYNKYELLKVIILDKETSEDARYWAGVIVINDFQYTDIERAKYFADSMIDNFPGSPNREQFQLIKESLMEFNLLTSKGKSTATNTKRFCAIGA